MLHVFYGNNTVAIRQKAFELAVTFEENGSHVERIDAESYVFGVCVDIAQSVSLFGGTRVYLLDTPSSDSLFSEETMAMLEVYADSANTYIVIEGPLLAAQKKPFAKYATSIEEIKKEAEERFNAFAMAESLSRKDKKSLWLQLQDAKQNGLSAEEIIGTLWWQLKTLRLAKLTSTAEEAGMKDYPYNKAKRSLSYFKDGELESLSRSLLMLYHQGHGGERDIDLALEAWTLSL